jgi:two-component system response regulator MtrA
MRILVVDDDSGICAALTVGLHLFWEDSMVIAARDGDEGLQAYHDHKPDVVLLDLTMAGKNGFDVLRQIRRVIVGRPGKARVPCW